MTKQRIAWLSAFVALAGPSCATTAQQKSTGTNWLSCHTDTDCAAVEGATCSADGICVDSTGRPISKGQVSRSSPDGSTAGASWARTDLSPTTSSIFYSAAVDVSGDVYAVGDLWGPSTLDFGNGVTATGTNSRYNALLVKYDSSGNAQWERTIGTDATGADFSSVALDSSGNLYAVGYLSGDPGVVDLGNGVTVTKSDTANDAFNNALLVGYDSSGTARWAHLVTAGGSDSTLNSVVVDSSGNIFVAGRIDGTGTYDFGNGVTATGVATSAGLMNPPGNAVLAKYDSSGTAQWAQTVTQGSPASSFSSVAVDSGGNAYAAGSIGGTGTYGFGNGVTAAGTAVGGPIGGEAAGNVALVKYDSSGVAQWARTVTAGSSGSGFSSVTVDRSGDVYAAGSIGEGTYDLGNGVTVAGTTKGGSFTGTAGPLYVVLAKYDSTGTAKWARTVTPGGSNSYLNSVAADASGNAYVAGAVHSTGIYDFGNGATISTDAHDTGYYAALVKYDPSGVAQWARSSAVTGSTADAFTGVTLDAAGTLYATGYLGGTGVVDFGNGVTATGTQLSTGSGWSPLLVKY